MPWHIYVSVVLVVGWGFTSNIVIFLSVVQASHIVKKFSSKNFNMLTFFKLLPKKAREFVRINKIHGKF